MFTNHTYQRIAVQNLPVKWRPSEVVSSTSDARSSSQREEHSATRTSRHSLNDHMHLTVLLSLYLHCVHPFSRQKHQGNKQSYRDFAGRHRTRDRLCIGTCSQTSLKYRNVHTNRYNTKQRNDGNTRTGDTVQVPDNDRQ